MSFAGALFGGSNPTLNSQIGTLGSIAGSSTKEGQTDTSDASKFFQSILAGDDKSLAPQIGSIKKQGQQKLQTLSQFGNRSGGTNATANSVGDTTTASINDLIQSLTGSAASNLGSLGTSLTNTGLSAYSQQAGVSQQQMQNWKNSILGQGITGAINYGESFLPIPHGG